MKKLREQWQMERVNMRNKDSKRDEPASDFDEQQQRVLL